MRNVQAKTDAQLVKETLENQEVFADLVERYEAKLLRYILRLSGFNRPLSEDILQEVFLKIYRNLNDFDPDLSFSSWAYRIAHNEAINHLKKDQRQRVLPLETEDEEVADFINVIASEIDIESDLRRKEAQKCIREVLEMLSPDFREVLFLRYMEEKDYREISDILEKPVGTVGTLINRAKAQFRQIAEKNDLIEIPLTSPVYE